jgi:NADH dehydrogenase (ubiquinone) 1 alpha/beta subcomplex 1
MFRTAIAKAAPSFRVASAPLIRPTLSFARPALTLSARGYAASAGLSKDDISSRVLEVMKTFEKVDGGKVRLFTRRLGFS